MFPARPSRHMSRLKKDSESIVGGKRETIERLSFTFTPQTWIYTTCPSFPLIFRLLYCFHIKLSSFMSVLTIGIAEDCFYLLISYSEKFSAGVWRLPFVVNVSKNVSKNVSNLWQLATREQVPLQLLSRNWQNLAWKHASWRRPFRHV